MFYYFIERTDNLLTLNCLILALEDTWSRVYKIFYLRWIMVIWNRQSDDWARIKCYGSVLQHNVWWKSLKLRTNAQTGERNQLSSADWPALTTPQLGDITRAGPRSLPATTPRQRFDYKQGDVVFAAESVAGFSLSCWQPCHIQIPISQSKPDITPVLKPLHLLE